MAGPARGHEAPRRLRILLVEDEAPVRTVITHQLGSEGHTVDSAGNGREGLETFMAGWFDLVITGARPANHLTRWRRLLADRAARSPAVCSNRLIVRPGTAHAPVPRPYARRLCVV
jgi:hypothetical protein